MTRRVIAALAATFLALVGAALVAAYVVGADQRALAQVEPVEVYVVTQEITSGAPVVEGTNVARGQIPRNAVVAGALTSIDELAGKVAISALHPGEQLLPDRFATPDELAGDLVTVPAGMVEVSVVLAPERVMGGRLKAGDTVGVVNSLGTVFSAEEPASSQTILHRVLVTRVQFADAAPTTDENGEEIEPVPGTRYITFAVAAPDAERIVWVAEHGRMWLTMERETSLVEGTGVVTQENVGP